MAEAAQQAAPLVVEGSEVALLIANRLHEHVEHLNRQLQGLQGGMDRLLNAHGLNQAVDAGSGEPALEVPVPPHAGDELPEIAEALLRGPLQRALQFDNARRANELLADGDVDEAVAVMRDVAEALRAAGSLTLAERYREWAALSLEHAGARDRAAELLVEVAFAQAQRGSDLTPVTANRLSDLLAEDKRWVAEGLEAMVVWPENPRGAIADLRSAVSSCSPDEWPGWTAALVEVLLITGSPKEGFDAAAPAREAALAPGPRVAIELDALEAQEDLGDGIGAEAGWQPLLSYADSGVDLHDQRGVVWQRRAATLLRRGDLAAATEAATRAVGAWSARPGAEEQAAEALLDLQSGAMALAQPPPGMELRALATSAEGSSETPIALAERLESRGASARTEAKLPDALRAWSLALALHHRAGNFRGELSASERLGELYAHANLPIQALVFYLSAGKTKEAVEIAGRVSGEALAEVLRLDVPRWQAAAVYEVLARHGRRLPPEGAAALGEQLLVDASAEPDGFLSPQPSISARQALAATLLTLPEPQRAAAIEQLREEVDGGYTPTVRAAAEALILATNAEVVDESELLIEGFLRDASLTGISSLWVAEQLSAHEEHRAKVREAALAGSHSALEALTAADLVRGDPELEEVANRIAESGVAIETVSETRTANGRIERSISFGVGFEGIAMIARGATGEMRRALVRRLLRVLSDGREPELNRASAASALFNLASSLPEDTVSEVVEGLRPLAFGEYQMSEIDRESLASQHPMSRFRFAFTAPDQLRSTALEAWARIFAAGNDSDLEILQSAVNQAFAEGRQQLLIGALRALVQVPDLTSPAPIAWLTAHPDLQVRLAALHAWGARHHKMEELETLPALLADPELPIRLTLVTMAREADDGAEVLAKLCEDPDAYVGAMAHAARREP
jgi:tetratricopeptide (TPR) repeat protein